MQRGSAAAPRQPPRIPDDPPGRPLSAGREPGYGATMNPEVLVVGSYVQDLIWRCGSFPHPGETIVGRFTAGPGGKGSNQAAACARAGVPTGFVGALGNDGLAREARDFHRREGIFARFATRPRLATGTAAILVNAAGENEIIVALGANAALRPADVAPAWIRRARVVVTQLESNLAATAHALRHARRAGVTTVLNPAPMRADFDPADTWEHIAGHRGVRVVDTTGAGDAFVGGFAAGLVRFDGDVSRAAHLANAGAALSVTKPGAAPAMPHRREIARFLRRAQTPASQA
jgi:sugar/nucleoside kinase (ribokinase family)